MTNSAKTGDSDRLVLPVWDAELVEIIISPGHDYWVKNGGTPCQHGACEVSEVECVSGRGLRGDRYFDHQLNHRGQVTFLAFDVVQAIREAFAIPDLPAALFRRNLVVRGVQLSQWLDKEFTFQGVRFQGTQECKPCVWMDRMIGEGVQRFLQGDFRGGLRAKVLSDGRLRVGKNDMPMCQ